MPTQNLLRFVSVADVDDENRVGNGLMQTWELKLGSVNILNFKFSRDGDVWLRF